MTDLINELRAQLAEVTAELEAEREAVAALGRSFDAMRAERDAEREVRRALTEALFLSGRRCETVHHTKADQHGGMHPCPVEARIAAALALAAKLPA